MRKVYSSIEKMQNKKGKNMLRFLLLFVLIAGACGCGLTNQDLGLEKSAPDEMMVVSRAPLSLPPEYNLRPAAGNDLPEENASFSLGEKSLLSDMR